MLYPTGKGRDSELPFLPEGLMMACEDMSCIVQANTRNCGACARYLLAALRDLGRFLSPVDVSRRAGCG